MSVSISIASPRYRSVLIWMMLLFVAGKELGLGIKSLNESSKDEMEKEPEEVNCS